MLEIIMLSLVCGSVMYGILFSCAWGEDALSDDKRNRLLFWNTTIWYWISMIVATFLLLIIYC